MKLLLMGADINPPWTEGRKKLVRDLATRLQDTCTVRLITTGRKHGVRSESYPHYEKKVLFNSFKLHGLHRFLADTLDDWSPDIVLHFPFGSFHGLRRLANEWSVRHVDETCRAKGIRCLTIFYSITDLPWQRLGEIAREPVACPASGWNGLTMTMGTDITDALSMAPKKQGEPAILFMAGLQETKERILQHILNERGLADVVAAAPELARAGVRVIVAIPLLKDRRLRETLRRHFLQSSPGIKLDLRTQISIPDIFAAADLYLFPYRKELTQFLPTSVLEAMAAGTPVVMSDLAMLAPLHGQGQTSYVYPPGDAGRLAEVILSALADPAGRQEKADRAQEFVRKHWSLERTVADLVKIIAG